MGHDCVIGLFVGTANIARDNPKGVKKSLSFFDIGGILNAIKTIWTNNVLIRKIKSEYVLRQKEDKEFENY